MKTLLTLVAAAAASIASPALAQNYVALAGSPAPAQNHSALAGSPPLAQNYVALAGSPALSQNQVALAGSTALAQNYAAFAGSPTPAQHGPARVAVSYADLDLSSRAGVRTLDRRIRTAVEQACGPISSFDPRGKNIVLDCRAETLAVARAQRDTAIAAATGSSPIELAAQR